jgi:UDP-3-O-[3-hydroxymyristoyl] N-acetylglucosamine deacetylase/3-hydroxyacyl-[acyl-carrier-protein] dehydratase
LSRQRTIEREVELSGRGLFTGFPVRMRFKPAAAGSGITFVRTDQPEPVHIAARLENLSKRARRTSIRNGTAAIETVEHCLAAARGLSLDNLVIELDNAEIPAVDGSSLPFVETLRSAGITELDAEREVLDVTEPVRVADGAAELVAWPGEPGKLEVIYELDYGEAGPIGHQIHRFTLDENTFAEQIAPSRTFVLDREAEQLRAAGLGLHLTYSDILVIGENGPIENEFRFENECVRHKILDLVGDLMLAGCFVCGRIYARQAPGTRLNHELVRRLLEDAGAAPLRGAPPGPAGAGHPRRAADPAAPLPDAAGRSRGRDGRATAGRSASRTSPINEPFFQGHYPRQPIMPGVLIIEAMAQLGGILMSQKLEHTGKVAVLLSLDKVKFRRPVMPGDQLVMEAQAVRVKARTGQTQCRASVGGELVAEATIRFMLVDADPACVQRRPMSTSTPHCVRRSTGRAWAKTSRSVRSRMSVRMCGWATVAVLGPRVTLLGPAEFGTRNRFHSGCVLGAAPQDLKYKGGPTRLVVGNENVFREHVTIHRGTEVDRQSGGVTRIGNAQPAHGRRAPGAR